MDKTANGVLNRLLGDIPAKYDKDVGSYVYDVLTAPAMEFESAYDRIDLAVQYAFAKTASGENLDRVLEQFGFIRKKATYAQGVVTVTGAEDAQIRTGNLVAAGRRVYQVLEDAVLTGGSAEVKIRAQSPGAAGNALPGEVNYFPVTLPKITAVTNGAAITGGADAESDEKYRERYYYFLAHPVTSGNKYEYEQWAREVNEVGLAKCYPLHKGAGTVKVVITTRDLTVPGDPLIQQVKDHIEEKRPVGADVTVTGAGTAEINVRADVTLDTGYSVGDVKKSYEENLAEYLNGIGFDGGMVPYTKVGAILQDIPGVLYYSGLTVNSGTANITVPDGSLAVLGGVELV